LDDDGGIALSAPCLRRPRLFRLVAHPELTSSR
jgi:hypothetical protein